MKKILIFTLVTLLMFSFSFQLEAKADTSDIHQMQGELDYWMNKGVIPVNTKSNKAVTRGEFASYMARALDLPISTKYKFKDLKANSSLTIEIQNVAGAGIISGYPDGTFKPNDKITRQQMAGMINKAFRHMDLPVQKQPLKFKDSKQISANFVDAVAVSVNLNIIRGDHRKDGVYFMPKSNATVAHAAAFLFRMFAAAEILKPEEPTVPSEPDTPTVPDVDPEVFKVSSISNGQVIPTTSLYRNYEDALAAYNASSSIRVIQKNNRIIKMKSGRAFGSQNPKQYTSLYNNSAFNTEMTYVQKGREMSYIGSSENHVILEVAGSTFYAKPSEVDLVPTELVTGYDYYEIGKDSVLYHNTYNNLSKSRGVYSVGPAPSKMPKGKKYTSFDGVHFDEVGSKNVVTHYPYFQFQSVRQPSTYSGADLDRYINDILVDRERSGIARYKDASLNSKLIGLGSYLKTIEQTYRVNALFILATAIHESDYGISANAQQKNNIFGIKVFDSTPELGEMYARPENSVDAFVTRYANLNYANPLGAHSNGAVPGNKAVGFNVKYASDPDWGSKVAGHMWRIDSYLGSHDYKQADLAVISYKGDTGVNVRTSPEVTSSNKLFTYKPKDPGYKNAFGYPLVIIEETTGSDGFQWFKVLADTNPPAEFGWIRSDLVTRISE